MSGHFLDLHVSYFYFSDLLRESNEGAINDCQPSDKALLNVIVTKIRQRDHFRRKSIQYDKGNEWVDYFQNQFLK
jgi:hypothetical protein